MAICGKRSGAHTTATCATFTLAGLPEYPVTAEAEVEVEAEVEATRVLHSRQSLYYINNHYPYRAS